MSTGDVYFNYGSRIESKRLAEAIAMPFGVGPICGFGSAEINGKFLKVYPWAVGDENGAGSDNFTDPARFLMRDLIRSHHIPRSEDADISAYRITFGCIAKDGILYRSGESSLNNIPIEGSKGVYNQVLLFAEHRHITEPVNNVVSFRAFWNESSFDFFNLYKESLDIYYPNSSKSRKASISEKYDPSFNRKLSYDYLMDKVEAACSTYQNYQKSMVLIGVYGDGINNDPDNGKVEKFAIVPYGGQFPVSLRYNWSIHSYFKEAINRIESFIDYTTIDKALDPDTGQSLNFTSLTKYLEWVINKKTAYLQQQIESVSLPTGSIILFDGEKIPKGWEAYDKAAGRVVIGYTAGGIPLNTSEEGNQTILQNLGDVYNPLRADERYQIVLKGTDLPKHYHGIGLSAGRQDNAKDAYSTCLCNFNNRWLDINGNMWDFGYNPVTNIVRGAVLSGANILDITDPTSETNKESLVISKLPPAITLRYIKKTSSSENVNKGT